MVPLRKVQNARKTKRLLCLKTFSFCRCVSAVVCFWKDSGDVKPNYIKCSLVTSLNVNVWTQHAPEPLMPHLYFHLEVTQSVGANKTGQDKSESFACLLRGIIFKHQPVLQCVSNHSRLMFVHSTTQQQQGALPVDPDTLWNISATT